MKVKATYWKVLLQLKSVYKSVNSDVQAIVITNDLEVVVSKKVFLSVDDLLIISFNFQNTSNKNFYQLAFNSRVSKKVKKIFELYLPYIIVNKNVEVPFSFVHIAQTIDGKIATPTGKSKWIGNKENLVHAHRTRALVDGILVGANTFKLDKPRLDVRHVNGENPIKIIVSNSKLELDCLSLGKTYLFSKNEMVYDNLPAETELIHIDQQEDLIDTTVLLKTLKQKGIHSLLIEGGSQTIRKFIEDKSLDRIEFHIAPLLFGSGKNGIDLGEIDTIEEAIELNNPVTFKIGNAIMIVANL